MKSNSNLHKSRANQWIWTSLTTISENVSFILFYIFGLEVLEKMKEIEDKQTSNNYLAKINAETENLEQEKEVIESDMLQMAKGMK